MFITRRQFLKYCAASAAALGLSQTDLLKIEKALAVAPSAEDPVSWGLPQTNINPLNGPTGLFMPRVIWVAGANCSGCATGLLNFVAGYNSGNYYDEGDDPYGDTPLPLGHPNPGSNHPTDPWGYYHGYKPVQTGVALEPEPWAETDGSLGAAVDLAGALDGIDLSALGVPANHFDNGLVDIGDVCVNVINIDYAYIVCASAGDKLNEHMMNVVQGSPGHPEEAQAYILLIEGAIQLKGAGKFCRIFEVPAGRTVTIRGAEATGSAPKCLAYHNDPYYVVPGVPLHPLAHLKTTQGVKTITEGEVTMMDTTAWLASQANCVAVLAMGTCATWGGIPAAKGNKTGATSAWDWLHRKNKIMSAWVPSINVPLINIPGCPPHPDWVVAPIVATILALSHAIDAIGTTYQNPPEAVAAALVAVYGLLDQTACSTKASGICDRPKLTFTPIFPVSKVFCTEGQCPRQSDPNPPTSIVACGRDDSHPNGRCLRAVGCNGGKGGAVGAKADCPTRMFNTHTNWCVGNNYPCQGCTDPNFPDGCAPFFSGSKGKWAGIQ